MAPVSGSEPTVPISQALATAPTVDSIRRGSLALDQGFPEISSKSQPFGDPTSGMDPWSYVNTLGQGMSDSTSNLATVTTTHAPAVSRPLGPKDGSEPRKIMAANRGEIAIRIIRTAHEMGMKTVAIFSHQDRLSQHRYKADEAYQICLPDEETPVGAYLAMDRIVKIAKDHNVTLVHPGYGFLSENAEFARKVEEAGMKFVGPTPETILECGDKTKARAMAIRAGVPVVPGTPGPVSSLKEAQDFIATNGLPVIIKAAMGGGGRGMRVVRQAEELANSFERAISEALASFGDGTVFIETFVDKPRHIEVQLLGDGQGNVIHLYERDCSVQRRHQKVVELAPALGLDDELRENLLQDAVKLAKSVNYRNAGTAEFLVDPVKNKYYFIEINPRIQVEHTISEEITGWDIISLQIQIALGASLPKLGISQDSIQPRGYSIQCRLTTEDPSKNFLPDTGRIEVYRSPGGHGIRLDGGNGFSGAFISPHYDSLLTKVITKGRNFEEARRKMIRALVEFRVRGVKTNVWFLLRLLTHEKFVQGNGVWTTFIDDTPSLLEGVQSKNRAQKVLNYLADMVVNGSKIQGQHGPPGLRSAIPLPLLNGETIAQPQTIGWRNILEQQGPEAFAKAIRQHRKTKGALIMDTTWRDAHQSLLATRLRTYDILRIAPTTSHALQNAFALECWGGATFDVAIRFLHEDPWQRLEKMKQACPNIPFSMLLRGANAVGYTNYPDNVTEEFCKVAKAKGVDIFRVFDSLNYVENMKFGIRAVKAAGGVCEAAISYTGDVSDPSKKKYNLAYYLDLAQQLVDEGIHILAIKDMAGLLKPHAATLLVGALREKFPDLVIHLHTHDTAGTGLASMLAGLEAGADVVDVAIDALSGCTSQPSMGALVASLSGSPLDTGIEYRDVLALNSYWEQVRLLYSCFDAGLKSGDSSVYEHEMPGGQYTNLLFQAQSLGLGEQWTEIKKAYKEANYLCGDIVKVTPSSKVVGDLAQFMVSNKLDAKGVEEKAETLSFPTSVVEYFQGIIGQPPGGFPEPLRSKIVKKLPKIEGRPGATMEPVDFKALKEELESEHGPSDSSNDPSEPILETDVLTAALYPKVFKDHRTFLKKNGDVSLLPTPYFLAPLEIGEELSLDIEQGKTLFIKLLATGPTDVTTGKREVYFSLNGQTRAVTVEDSKTTIKVVARQKADVSVLGEVGCPMSGVVLEVRAKEGTTVKVGDPICVLSAMKMETVVSATVSGRVDKLYVKPGESLNQGDLIVKLVAETAPRKEDNVASLGRTPDN